MEHLRNINVYKIIRLKYIKIFMSTRTSIERFSVYTASVIVSSIKPLSIFYRRDALIRKTALKTNGNYKETQELSVAYVLNGHIVLITIVCIVYSLV